MSTERERDNSDRAMEASMLLLDFKRIPPKPLGSFTLMQGEEENNADV